MGRRPNRAAERLAHDLLMVGSSILPVATLRVSQRRLAGGCALSDPRNGSVTRHERRDLARLWLAAGPPRALP